MSGAFCCIAMARIKLKNSQVKDKAPLATDLDVGGEIAVNHHADNPGIFLKDTAGAVRKIAGPGSISTSAATEAAAGIVELATLAETATGTDASRAVHPAGLKALLSATLTPGSATAPAGPATGATYIDSSVSPAVVAVWDGAAWVKQVGTATTSATAPTAPVTGQVYLDTSTSPAVAKLWNGAAWINLTTDTAVQSKLDAQLAGIWSRTGTVLSPATAGDVVNISAGTAALPGLAPVGDPGSGIYSPSVGRLAISTAGAQRVFVGNAGNVGIGPSTSLGARLDVNAASTDSCTIRARNDTTSVYLEANNGYAYLNTFSNHPLLIGTNNLERARIDSSGRLLVGTSSWSANATLVAQGNSGGSTSGAVLYLSLGANNPADGIALGNIEFSDSTPGRAATISGQRDGGTWTAGSSHPGRLVFSTTADGESSPTERMRIKSNGGINVTTNTLYTGNGNNVPFQAERTTSDGPVCQWYRVGALVGHISVTSSATTYNTSSDYRLKENVTTVTDGITRLLQLKPSRFNFIVDPAKTVDGFIAHEVQTVVPEAITGKKDAVDADGNPVYQGIDQSKLVPLLTAALQEAIGEIEKLKARVVALESKP
jgi:hypothetical protein